jgi:hypothetical protein
VEVAVTALHQQKRSLLGLFPPSTALREEHDAPPGHGEGNTSLAPVPGRSADAHLLVFVHHRSIRRLPDRYSDLFCWKMIATLPSVIVRIFPATNLRRQPSVTTCRGQWGACPLALVLIVSSPFRTVVNSLFLNNESTVLTDGFDRVGSDPACTRDMSSCWSSSGRSRQSSFRRYLSSLCFVTGFFWKFAGTANPSSIEAKINAIEYGLRFSWIVVKTIVL